MFHNVLQSFSEHVFTEMMQKPRAASAVVQTLSQAFIGQFETIHCCHTRCHAGFKSLLIKVYDPFLVYLHSGLICIEHLGSLSSSIASYRSSRPPTTECCCSARWPLSWQSWRTISDTATFSTCVLMVSSHTHLFEVSWAEPVNQDKGRISIF